VTGVTGARESIPTEIKSFVERVRKATTLPLCVGFGVSTPEQAREIARSADGVIVGSRLIQLMEEKDNWAARVGEFTGELRKALNEAAA